MKKMDSARAVVFAMAGALAAGAPAAPPKPQGVPHCDERQAPSRRLPSFLHPGHLTGV